MAKQQVLIKWKFKCFNCGYRFRAIEPQELIDIYDKCTMCGSKNFEKKVTK